MSLTHVDYMSEFVVICKDMGEYVLASRRVFVTLRGAEAYAATIDASREPMIIPGKWSELRWTALPEER